MVYYSYTLKGIKRMTEQDFLAIIQAHTHTIESLQQTIENLNETVEQFKRMIFGASSEKSSATDSFDILGQLNLFNDVEDLAVESPMEPSVAEILADAKEASAPTEPKKNKSKKEERFSSFVEKKETLLEGNVGEDICDICGETMSEFTTEVAYEEIEVIPARIIRHIFLRKAFLCQACKADDVTTIQRQNIPKRLIPGSAASASAVSYTMYQKYVNAMPLYRQEQDWKQMGVHLTRATLANWVNTCSISYLNPLYELLHQKLILQEVLLADETPCQVLKEKGRTPQQKSYMWCYRTNDYATEPIILYEYQPGRSGEYAKTFLGEDFDGFLQTDGYSGYNRLKHVTRCGCFAHTRRKMLEAVPKKNSTGKHTAAEIGLAFCDKLFFLERDYKNLTPDERKAQRLIHSKPVMEAFWRWLNTLNPPSGSKLATAITYAKNQRPYLENILKDGRVALSTNLVENSIRPFTIGRKNFLFFDTPKGATAGQIIYSLVETAKANSINPRLYLETILTYMPGYQNEPAGIEQLLPWSDFIVERCRG